VAAKRKEADDHIRWVRDEVTAERARLAGHRETSEAELDEQRVRLAEDRQALEALLSSRVRGFDFIANAWADYEGRARAYRPPISNTGTIRPTWRLTGYARKARSLPTRAVS
jgi:hypothetical protein